MSTNTRIIVTGDLVREVHLYQGARPLPSQPTAAGTRVWEQMGGATLLGDILEAARPDASILGLIVDDKKPWPEHLRAYALYAAGPVGFKDDPKPAPGAKTGKIWRVAQAIGYGRDASVPPVEPPVTVRAVTEGKPDVLLIDDGGAGFRTQRAQSRWPDGGEADHALPYWVILKASQPIGDGYLWRHLVAKCAAQSAASHLVVIVSADELRRDGAAISRGLSWEHTVSETYRVLAQDPRFVGLRQAAHLFVVFRREGALWLSPSAATSDPSSPATLVFDPRLAEGQWKEKVNDAQGQVFGHLSVFTAAIALEFAERRNGADFHDKLIGAIQRGLVATRELYLRGHGIEDKKTDPSFPFKGIADVLNGTMPTRLKHQPADHFASAALPSIDAWASLGPDWTIASQNDPKDVSVPLYGLGFQTAVYGPARLSNIPQARFGELLTIDRTEIETLRGLRQIIQAYEHGGRQKQPLCIGAFGPPGAGKSFGIKQIAIEVLGDDVPFLEFNLSQFSDPAELIGAFHQVRDKVLTGRTPVVFWDEFDSDKLRWLQFLLAPMQDGKFQSGQLTHTLGKCVFVFAGATSWDFEHFGPAPMPSNTVETEALTKRLADNPAATQARRDAEAEFRLKKGPDFISRLNGHINVLGPNRRLLFNFTTGEWDRPDPADITFPVRRALLLRSFLKAKDADALEIDRDLLSALIRQPRYRHGARSMEKIVEPLRVAHTPLRLAQLPMPQVLAQHLDTTEAFQKLLAENAAFLTRDNLRALAAAIHENYRRLTDTQYIYDPQFREAYDRLTPWGRATNLAAAARIPYVLSMAGLCVEQGQAVDVEAVRERLRRYLDPLRREEHVGWMNYLTTNGWLQSHETPPVRIGLSLIHTCLQPFDDLEAGDQGKDDQAIASLPEVVALVGFRLTLVRDWTREPVV